MDKKGLLISTDIDTTEVEKKLSELQKKINSFRSGGLQMDFGGNNLGGANQASVDRMRQSQLDVFKRLQGQISSELSEQVKDHQNVTKQLDEQTKKLKEINKETKEYADLRKEIKKLQKDEEDSLNSIARLQAQKAQMQGLDPRSAMDKFKEFGGMGALGKAFNTRGFGGVNQLLGKMGFGGIAGLAGSAMGGLGAGLGAIGGGMQMLGNFNSMLADLPARQAGRQLGIAQGTTQMRGRGIRGDNLEDIIFAPERARAIGKTMDFFEEADSARLMRARGKAVAGVGGVLGAGATGAAIGTAIMPGIGTAIGAGLGAVGAGLGIFGGSEEAYYGLTNNKGALSQMTGEEAMQRYETFKMNERMKDPTKYYQKKFYAENRDRLLALQRSGGLSEDELYGEGGFIQSGAQDFRFSQRANMANQITAAGGSGSAATRGGLNVLALQAQRSMGLTNAGQTLGRLSGYMGAEESEDAFIRILSKGVSVGLDDSQFREEQKDYFAQVTAIASQIGGGEDMVSAAIAAGVEGDISRRGVQMSADAFQALEGALNQQGGVTAAARASMISENDMFSNIKGMDRLAFQRMQMKDIREDSDVMEMYFKKATGKDIKGNEKEFSKFVNERQDIQRKALFKAYEGTEIGDRLSKFYQTGKDRQLTDEEIAKAQEMLKMIPGFENMSEEQLKRTTKMYLGTERIEEEDKKKRKGALQRQKEMQEQMEEDKKTYGSRQFEYRKEQGYYDLSEEDQKYLLKDRVTKGEGTAIDKEEKARAQQQAKQFEQMSANMNEMFSNIANSLDQTLADQIKMESFNEALKGGADAVQTFLDALRGRKKPEPPQRSASEKRKNDVGASSGMGGRGY